MAAQQPVHQDHKIRERFFAVRNADLQQCFLFSRNIGELTPKIIILHYLKKSFLDQSIQKCILFNFEKGSTDLHPRRQIVKFATEKQH